MSGALQSGEELLQEVGRLRLRLAELEAEASRNHEALRLELRRAKAFLDQVVASSMDAIIAADMKGKILIFNQPACQITGYSQEEALAALNSRDLYPADGAREVMRQLRSEGRLDAYRLLLRKDGTTVPVRLSAAIVYDGQAEIGTIGFFYDLRERRRMEQELNKTRLQLLQAEKMASLGRLAAGVAHQLNNPLCEIALFAELVLEEHQLEEATQSDLRRIATAAQRCRDIVRELLQFARQTTREVRLQDINDLLSRTISILKGQPLFKQIEIKTELLPALPLVPADAQQISQVFMNVLLNAADALEGRGVITVRSCLSPEADRAVVEISDNGPGIKEEILPHIFEPFFTTKEEGKGTGLGLSVAYGIIEEHRGRIWARSWPGEGASFFIELPLRGEADGI